MMSVDDSERGYLIQVIRRDIRLRERKMVKTREKYGPKTDVAGIVRALDIARPLLDELLAGA